MCVMTCCRRLFLGRMGFFFFQAEDGIRDATVTGVQTCALPISTPGVELPALRADAAAAIGVCAQAAAAHPEIAHYTALLARAEAAAGRMDEAYAHFRKAADAGDARAMYSLGLMLETGDHAPKDLKAAYALYEKAAERGLADGAINLAVALAEGKGIAKNLPRAYALLQQASASGSARAT